MSSSTRSSNTFESTAPQESLKVTTSSLTVKLVKEEQQRFMLPLPGILFLKDVIQGAGLFAMRDIDPLNLESLTCSDPKTWPDIYVTRCDRGFICFDGRHRVEAGKLLKLETLPATCVSFTSANQLIEASFKANLKHGLRASDETRADYCYWLSITFPEMTQQEIADRVGVTQSRVSRAIQSRKNKLEAAAQKLLKQAEEATESEDDVIGQWTENVLKRARSFTKTFGKYSNVIKDGENYNKLVYDLQLELLQEAEDREALRFIGQLFLDAAQRRPTRRGKTS